MKIIITYCTLAMILYFSEFVILAICGLSIYNAVSVSTWITILNILGLNLLYLKSLKDLEYNLTLQSINDIVSK